MMLKDLFSQILRIDGRKELNEAEALTIRGPSDLAWIDPLSDALINKGDSGNAITWGEGTGDGLKLAYALKKIKELGSVCA